MDNRLKFLYRNITELWGHRRKAWAGSGDTGTSGDRSCKGKSVQQSEDVTWSERKVAKHADRLSRKAAIVYIVPVPKTDTGG